MGGSESSCEYVDGEGPRSLQRRRPGCRLVGKDAVPSAFSHYWALAGAQAGGVFQQRVPSFGVGWEFTSKCHKLRSLMTI